MDSQIKVLEPNLALVMPNIIATEQARQLQAWLQQQRQSLKPISRESQSKSTLSVPQTQASDPLSNHNLGAPQIQRLLGLAGKSINRQTYLPAINSIGQASPSVEQTLRLEQQLAIYSGELLFSCDDFSIPGPIDFSWQRIYRSSSDQDYGLGPGWHHPLCERLLIEKQAIIYSSPDGRRITFGLPAIGDSCINRCEGLVVQRQGQHSYRIIGFDSASKLFRADGISKHLPLVELRDALDNTISIDYQDGLPHKIVTSWGRVLECLNENGKISEIHNANGSREQSLLAHYEYSDDRLVTAYDQHQAVENYLYQQQRLQERIMACGKQYDYHWQESSNRYTTITSGDFQQVVHWQDKTHSARITGNDAIETFYRFNEGGQAVLIRDGEGNENKRFYDSYGNLCSDTNALGHSRYYRRDNNSRPTRITDELGNSTHIRYDRRGQPSLITDALGHHWQQRYNSHGLLTSGRDPVGNHWLYHYNDRHQLECLEDPEGGKTRLCWNSQYELTQVISPGGLVSDYEYNHWGKVTSITVAGTLQQRYHYNKCGRLESSSNATGDSREFTYTANGALLTVREPDASGIEYRYDDRGRKSASRSSDGRELQFRYDLRDRLIEMQSSAGIERWSYNACSQILSYCDAQERRQNYSYDSCQRLLEHRDMDVVMYIERNAAGLITGQSTNCGDKIQFHYDALSNLTLTDNGSSSIRYQYDACGKIIAEHHDTDFGDGHSLNHRYDKRGWRISSSSDDQLVSYIYTPDSQLYGIDVNGESVLRCNWDDKGCDTEWIQGVVKTALGYDPLAQLQQLDSQLTSSNQALSSHTFAASGPVGRAYLPRLGITENAPSLELGVNQQQDQRGNLLSEQQGTAGITDGSHYQYNGLNQLNSSECGDFKTYYRYDPLGRRISKLTSHRKSQISRHTLFKWNGAQLWSEEHDRGQSRELTHYIFHPQRLAPIAMRKNEQLFYYQLNPQQQPLQIVDQKGELVWQAQYLSDGQFNGLAAKPKVSSPWRGASDYYDSETQLLFDGCGYYSPKKGQYIHKV